MEGARRSGSRSRERGEVDVCPICHEGMRREASAALLCGHAFHRACIDRWLDSRETCPCCRRREAIDRDGEVDRIPGLEALREHFRRGGRVARGEDLYLGAIPRKPELEWWMRAINYIFVHPANLSSEVSMEIDDASHATSLIISSDAHGAAWFVSIRCAFVDFGVSDVEARYKSRSGRERLARYPGDSPRDLLGLLGEAQRRLRREPRVFYIAALETPAGAQARVVGLHGNVVLRMDGVDDATPTTSSSDATSPTPSYRGR
jgi:hypothetical protein